MSQHLSAEIGEIAPYVMMPGDPLRAQFIAEKYLEDTVCYNHVRGMLGFTGTYHGVRISVQGSGMGMPSMDIYATELLRDYGVESIIRIGTCGGVHDELACRDLLMASTACTDSMMNRQRTPGDYAAAADFNLLHAAYHAAKELGYPARIGPVLSSDYFYMPNPEDLDVWKKYGVLAVEMEACALYTRAAEYGAQALALLTVSNHIYTGVELTPKERERTLDEMIQVALHAFIGID